MKNFNRSGNAEKREFFFWAIGCGLAFITSGFSDGLAAKQPKAPLGPISRKEFVGLVYLGMPENDLREAVGDPDAELQSEDPQLSDLIYHSKIIGEAGGREDVRVILFKDYRNVFAIEWADGSRIER